MAKTEICIPLIPASVNAPILWRAPLGQWKNANSCVTELLCLDEFIQYSHLCLKAKGPISLGRKTSPRLPLTDQLRQLNEGRSNSGDYLKNGLRQYANLDQGRRRRDCRDWSKSTIATSGDQNMACALTSRRRNPRPAGDWKKSPKKLWLT